MSCSAKRDPNGTWHIQYRWTDWTGTKKKSQKRGFKTKKEAEECGACSGITSSMGKDAGCGMEKLSLV